MAHDTEKLRELLERVEAASGPSRAIDYAVGDAIDPKEWRLCPSYSASLDASIALVERLIPDHELFLAREGRSWWAVMGDDQTTPDGSLWSPTAPLAILSALLRALISQAEGEAQHG